MVTEGGGFRTAHRVVRGVALLLLLGALSTSAAPLPETPPVTPAAVERMVEERSAAFWRLPVAAAEQRPFARPPAPWGAGHRGVDLGPLSAGATIRAPADGEVSFAGVVVDRPVLSIRHAGGYLSSFEPVQTDLEVGDPVSTGDPVGTFGEGHRHCEDPCLHWGVRLHGEYINPLLLTGDLEPSVLLPLGEQ